ncbi:MAG: alpha/beta hydrolase [Anaerolineae bacterium]|nr:MAG: alpha/beta hydrolase [Anaerolineae bacterium]
MKRFLKISLLSLLFLLLLSVGGFVMWAETPARPGPTALAALESDERVYVFQREDHIVFYPAICEAKIAEENRTGQPHTITAFVFYPGGRVDYRAYAPALRKIAEEGIIVFLLRVRLNLAFFDIEAGAPLLSQTEGVDVWTAGGHSLGGVAASLFAQNHPEVRAVVFWASYPADERFKAAELPVLSVYGTLDGLASPDRIQQSRVLLPSAARFVPIEGGNHAQFGDYGLQNGDNLASISPEAQWQQAAQVTASFLQTLSP